MMTDAQIDAIHKANYKVDVPEYDYRYGEQVQQSRHAFARAIAALPKPVVAIDLSQLHRYDISGDGPCFAPNDGSYVLYDDLAALHAASGPDVKLAEAMQSLYQGYVRTLEACRDKILDLGGDCDPVDRMEAADPELRKARAALAALKPTT